MPKQKRKVRLFSSVTSANTAYTLRAIALALRDICCRKRRICWERYLQCRAKKREVKSMGKIKPTQRIYAVVKDIEDDRRGTNLFPEVKILESLPYPMLGRMFNSRTELRL